jgi:hypothetical protein
MIKMVVVTFIALGAWVVGMLACAIILIFF